MRCLKTENDKYKNYIILTETKNTLYFSLKFSCLAKTINQGVWLGYVNQLSACPVVLDCLGPQRAVCSPPGSSVHGIFQARILEWVASSFFGGFSQPRDKTRFSCVFCFAGEFFAPGPPGKPKQVFLIDLFFLRVFPKLTTWWCCATKSIDVSSLPCH